MLKTVPTEVSNPIRCRLITSKKQNIHSKKKVRNISERNKNPSIILAQCASDMRDQNFTHCDNHFIFSTLLSIMNGTGALENMKIFIFYAFSTKLNHFKKDEKMHKR